LREGTRYTPARREPARSVPGIVGRLMRGENIVDFDPRSGCAARRLNKKGGAS
jgi:hypothetical protein